jgi:hypothetical protein
VLKQHRNLFIYGRPGRRNELPYPEGIEKVIRKNELLVSLSVLLFTIQALTPYFFKTAKMEGNLIHY